MTFKDFIKEIVLKKIDRIQLITKLHLNHPEFSGLDQITFSRWKNGITTPSVLKQILIAKESDTLWEYITSSETPNVNTNLSIKYQKYINQFDNYYHAVNDDFSKNKYYYYTGNVDDSVTIYGHFLDSSYVRNEFLEERVKKGVNFNVEVFYRSDKNMEEACSYVLLVREPSALFSLLEQVMRERVAISRFYNGCIYVSLSYFASSKDFEILAGFLLNHIFWQVIEQYDVMLTIRGKESINFLESIGAKRIALVEASKRIGNIYLYHLKWKDFVGSSVIIKIIKNQATNYFYNDINNDNFSKELTVN